MKCKLRFNKDLYLRTGEKKLQIHFDQNMYCLKPEICAKFESIMKNVIEDSDFPLKQESLINHILATYYHDGTLFNYEPIFNNMYVILKESHMFYKLEKYKELI